MKELNAKGRRILIVPDTHMPFQHIDMIGFLRAVRLKYIKSEKKEPIILHLGDEIDGHNISFHDTDPDLPFSPSKELEEAINYIKGLEQLFPKMYLCESNHGSLIFRRAKHHGLPKRFFKSYGEVLDTPKWEWNEDYILETNLGRIYVCHGKTSIYGKLAKEMGCSAIQGHFHGKFEITWHKTSMEERFNLFSGCLVDRDSMAFEYGKNHLPKPILGCSLISSSGYPQLIKMELNKKNRWTGNLP